MRRRSLSTTIIQTILLGLLGLFSNAEWFLGTCYIQRPLILGPLTGLIMGDLQAEEFYVLRKTKLSFYRFDHEG